MHPMSGIRRTYLIGMFRCLVSLLRSPAVEVQGPVFLVVLLILMYSGVARAHGTPGRCLSIVFPSGRACAHGTPASQIVGQLCTTKGCVPDGGKVAKILKWLVPETVVQVRRFLGLCGTLRIWIPNYSMRIRPLVKLTQKEAELEWGDEQQKAFEDMKVCVTNVPVLQPLDYQLGRPIVLSVDTS
jgi:hypothetical protein